MTGPLIFIDTETTGLHVDKRLWEIALIRRDDPEKPDKETWMQVIDVDLSSADPAGLKIGRFYDRHLMYAEQFTDAKQLTSDGVICEREQRIAERVERITRKASLVAVNPAFDAAVLDAMLRRHGLLPAWHYHLIDICAVAIGWLTALGHTLEIPAKSEELSHRCGIDPAAYARHTAMGDARWVRDWYDAIHFPKGPAS